MLHLILVGDMCDGMVLQIDSAKLLQMLVDENNCDVDVSVIASVVVSLSNWAPVWDFGTLDYFKENQDQVFAVTGKHSKRLDNNGAICVIRNGIALNPILLSNQKDFLGYLASRLLKIIFAELRRCGT